jgi:predicted nucleic acid-binding protein
MEEILVDSNVILDVLTEDPRWFEWSAGRIETLAEDRMLVINPLIYSEVSVGFERIETLDEALPSDYFRRDPLPWEAGFLAGKCYQRYRRGHGVRRSPLPEFYIGAHAAVADMTLLTRDVNRYRTYFPRLRILCP